MAKVQSFADKAKGKKKVEGVTVKAVSYTHLRAHETVLDLVCRLLLEKKKISNLATTMCIPDKYDTHTACCYCYM